MKNTLTYPVMLDPVEIVPAVATQDQRFLMLETSIHPSASVVAIVVETSNGKRVLQFSPDEIRKIEWGNEKLFIYFGKKVPFYTRGWIYLQEFKTI